jgi:hypothetical protein
VNIIRRLWWSLRRGNPVVPSRWQATFQRVRFGKSPLGDGGAPLLPRMGDAELSRSVRRKVWKWCVNAGPARRDLVRRGPQPHAQQCIRRAFVGRKPTLMALLRASVVENEMSRQRLLSEMMGGQDVLMQPLSRVGY